VPSWVQKLREGYEKYGEDKKLLAELAVSGENDKGFALVDGIIRLNGRIWVEQNVLAQQHILQALHASGIGGHSGISATYGRVKALFALPDLKQAVQQFVQQCEICQQAKVEHTRLPGLL
jgi:hypothetical protein